MTCLKYNKQKETYWNEGGRLSPMPTVLSKGRRNSDRWDIVSVHWEVLSDKLLPSAVTSYEMKIRSSIFA